MIKYFIIGAGVAVALLGLGVACWSIHRVHEAIFARDAERS